MKAKDLERLIREHPEMGDLDLCVCTFSPAKQEFESKPAEVILFEKGRLSLVNEQDYLIFKALEHPKEEILIRNS